MDNVIQDLEGTAAQFDDMLVQGCKDRLITCIALCNEYNNVSTSTDFMRP